MSSQYFLPKKCVYGVTLPFISYGGSSLLVSMISIGIILNIGSGVSLNKK